MMYIPDEKLLTSQAVSSIRYGKTIAPVIVLACRPTIVALVATCSLFSAGFGYRITSLPGVSSIAVTTCEPLMGTSVYNLNVPGVIDRATPEPVMALPWL